jgi:hypothetical protein
MHGTKIHGIVSRVQWNLELQVISIILRSIGNLANELGGMNMRFTTFLTLLLGGDHFVVFEFNVSLLGKACDLFLSHLSAGMPALHFSQLTVVHIVGIDQNLFAILRYSRSLNNKVDVSFFRKLQIINMVNILSLQINSNYTLLPSK